MLHYSGCISNFRMGLKSHARICDLAYGSGTWNCKSHRFDSILFQRISIRCMFPPAKN